MELAVGEWFRLPRLGKDAFISIMKAGAKYQKNFGFRVSEDADLAAVASILARVLGEEVTFVAKCYLCDEAIHCSSCAYYQGCDLTRVSPSCVCHKCMSKGDVLALYHTIFLMKRESGTG